MFVLISVSRISAFGQDSTDYPGFTLLQLADSVHQAFEKGKVGILTHVQPGWDVFCTQFDSNTLKKQMYFVKGNYGIMEARLKKQFKKIRKAAKKENISLKNMQKDTVTWIEDVDEKGRRFAYVTLELTKGKKSRKIRFLSVMLKEDWYLFDELKWLR